MKKFTFCIITAVQSVMIFAQVGIGTNAPTTTLDIDGNCRIRSIAPRSATTLDSVMVASGNGTIQRISSKQLIHLTLPSAVKAKYNTSSGAIINLSIASGAAKIPYNQEEFDTNNEFDTTTNTFTAKQDGIYAIYAQIKSNSTAVAVDYGLAILKNNTVVARQTFDNLSLLGIELTQPTRSVQTLIQLSTNDTIKINVLSSLLSASLIGNSMDTFLTIHQIR